MKEVRDFKWICILEESLSKSGKTKIFLVLNKLQNIPIAEIRWQPKYRKYALFPLVDSYFEETCLENIAVFLKELK
jgi:hypothetical protein